MLRSSSDVIQHGSRAKKKFLYVNYRHGYFIVNKCIRCCSSNSFRAKKVKNPTDKSSKEDLAIGKSLYTKHCQSCHGKEGYGDGPKAKELKGKDLMGVFSTAAFQSQTDGALFYKMTTGRDDMPAFDKKIPDAEDPWLIVNYIRTLKQ